MAIKNNCYGDMDKTIVMAIRVKQLLMAIWIKQF